MSILPLLFVLAWRQVLSTQFDWLQENGKIHERKKKNRYSKAMKWKFSLFLGGEQKTPTSMLWSRDLLNQLLWLHCSIVDSLALQSISLKSIGPGLAPKPAMGTAASAKKYSSCLHMTCASFKSQSLSQIVPHLSPSLLISTRPAKGTEERLNPFPSKWVLRALIDFTLSNARRFYSSMGNLLDRKGLSEYELW